MYEEYIISCVLFAWNVEFLCERDRCEMDGSESAVRMNIAYLKSMLLRTHRRKRKYSFKDVFHSTT